MTTPSNANRDRAVMQINCAAAKCTSLCPLCDSKCQMPPAHKGMHVGVRRTTPCKWTDGKPETCARMGT